MRPIQGERKGVIYTELMLDSSKAKEIVERHEFDQHNKKGYLTREELLQLIKEQELKTGRDVKGVVITLVVTKDDVNTCLKNEKLGQKKKIKPKHLRAVLEAWEEMAEKKLEEKEESACCLIL